MTARFRWAIFLSFSRLFLTSLHAQDSIPVWERSIEQITINGEARLLRHSNAAFKADSLPIEQLVMLADRVFWENSAALRSNGPGALATLSIRGAGPSRSPVLWNGLSLQSPMNGVMDLALIPIWPDDQFQLQTGAWSETPGAMGGRLMIASAPRDETPGWKGLIQGAAGSFGFYEGGASLGFSGKTYAGKIRGAWQSAENDFRFLKKGIDGQNHSVTQTNNAIRAGHLQQFNRWISGVNDTIKTAFWYHNAFREIAPASTESYSDSWQEDRSFRFTADWAHGKSKLRGWNARVAGAYDFLAFRLGQDVDTSISPQLRVNWERYQEPGSGWRWRWGAQTLHQWARTDGYTDTLQWYSLTRVAGFGFLEKRTPLWGYSLQIRQELAENHEKPFTFQLQTDYGNTPWGRLRFHLARNVNLPTFNEKYWKGLGRSDLKPEKGFSTDLGWRWETYRALLDVSVFHMTVDDWILWSPDSSGFFRPDNLRKVWSRGFEMKAKWEKRYSGKNGWTAGIGVNAQVSRTTNTAVYDEAKELLGAQLPYTPRVSGGINLKCHNSRYALTYFHQFMGKRLDNVGKPLPAFQTGNLLISTVFRKAWTLDLRLDNLLNTRYEVIRYRPMPGFNFRIGLRYSW